MKITRQRVFHLLLELGVVAVFDIMGVLYRLPLETFLYTTAICLLVILGIFVWQSVADGRKYQTLKRMSDMQYIEEHLPQTTNAIEQRYELIVRRLLEELRSEVSREGRLSSERNDYFTMWVHQIKTPIAAIDLMLQERDDEKSRELGVELMKIEQYVEMVLSYIRLEEQGNDWVLAECDLDEVVRDVIRRFAKQFIRSKLQLYYEEKHILALTDRKWLEFVLMQIISNALKYTKEGSVTIDITENLEIRISDTGIGIAKEDLPRVCEKGYTGYNGRSNQKSTGIGLYLSKKVLDRLGHGLSITSEVGVGTTVILELESVDLQIE